MRILFVGDYSNLHATLAAEIKRLGHEVDVLSDRCRYMDTHSDIYLKRLPGFKGSIKYLYDLFSILPSLKDYDAVQLINPNFFSLRPGKIKYFFQRLKEQNNKIFLTLAGNDYYFCKACYDAKIFRFSEFKIGNKFTEFHTATPERLYGWISHDNNKWNQYLYENIDGAMAVLPEYDMVARPILGDKVAFTNLPIDFSSLPQPIYSANMPVKIFIGMRSGMEIQKGTKKLLGMAKELEKNHPGKIIVEKVSDLPLSTYLDRMNNSHIVLDQLYAYSPAMNALYAMALGKVAATGAQPEYYEYIGNPETKPIFSLSPLDTDIEERILELAAHPEHIISLGKESRELVKANNDSKIVAAKFLHHWENSL